MKRKIITMEDRNEENERRREETNRLNGNLDNVLKQDRFQGKSLFECRRVINREFGAAMAKVALERIEEHKDELSATDLEELEEFKRSLEPS